MSIIFEKVGGAKCAFLRSVAGILNLFGDLGWDMECRVELWKYM